MTEPIPRCPYGVIWFDGKPLCYEPFNEGFRVIVQGTGEPVGVTPELRAAIEADIAKQAQKAGRA